ncbi:MAG: UDP-N-acetylglucosamine 1-carboxyvinyltransferase, partial [Arenicellales bacterium]
MESLLIRGGRPLRGHVRIGGSKNAALPVLMSSLLTEKDLLVANVP